MNERIKLLAEQAGLKWKAQPPHYTNTNNPIDFPVSANRDLEKFAELIVKECFRVVDDFGVEQTREPENYLGESLKVSMKITDAAWKIKEHFGVEE